MPDRSWGQLDIENEIIRLSGILEDTTDEFATACLDAAGKEATYRVEYAKAFARHRITGDSEKTSEANATVEVGELLGARRSAEALQRGLEEKCRSLRSSLDAVRTLSANVRAQT